MLTFKKFATLQILLAEYDAFLELAPQYSLTIENIDRAYKNGIPDKFYFIQVSYENAACLFDIGRALERLTLH